MYKRLTGFIVVCAIAAFANAATITEDTDWTGEFEDWSIEGSAGSAYGTTGEGGSDDWLEITGGTASLSPEEDYIFSDSTLAGDSDLTSDGVQSIAMDFYSESSTDYSVSFYFLYNDGVDDYIWLSDISASGTGWNTYFANLEFINWYNVSGPNDSATFATSLTDVDEIGILLTYEDNVGSQVYGIDDFQLNDNIVIPGPQTWLLLGFTFVSMGMTFRTRLSGFISRFRS